jgi:hypothetical protein
MVPGFAWNDKCVFFSVVTQSRCAGFFGLEGGERKSLKVKESTVRLWGFNIKK